MVVVACVSSVSYSWLMFFLSVSSEGGKAEQKGKVANTDQGQFVSILCRNALLKARVAYLVSYRTDTNTGCVPLLLPLISS